MPVLVRRRSDFAPPASRRKKSVSRSAPRRRFKASPGKAECVSVCLGTHAQVGRFRFTCVHPASWYGPVRQDSVTSPFLRSKGGGAETFRRQAKFSVRSAKAGRVLVCSGMFRAAGANGDVPSVAHFRILSFSSWYGGALQYAPTCAVAIGGRMQAPPAKSSRFGAVGLRRSRRVQSSSRGCGAEISVSQHISKFSVWLGTTYQGLPCRRQI